MPILQPGQEFGSYRVVERAGAGGMATVYKAYQTSLSRFVALKLLPDQLALDPEFRARFEREARSVAALRHPAIPAVHDYGILDDISYIVTEYIDGGTLAEQTGKPLPASYVVEILRPIANALDYAHSRGVLHRDIKPSNIMLARTGSPFLNDFGLAQILVPDVRVTAQGALMGTPAYMAPEQAQGQDLGPPADIYALATVAYEMLTGRVPYSAATPAAILMAQVHDPLPLPRSVNPELSEALEGVLLRGLSKDPKQRHQTAGKLVSAIEDVAKEPPPRPEPVPVAPVLDSSTQRAQPVISAAPVPVPAAPGLPAPSAPRAPYAPLAAGAPRKSGNVWIPVLAIGGAFCLLVIVVFIVGLVAASKNPGGNGNGDTASVPRGAVAWQADFSEDTTDLEPWGDVSTTDAADRTLDGSTLEYDVKTKGGFVGDSLKGTPELDAFVAHIEFELPQGSKATLDWNLANGNGTNTGTHFLRIDPDINKVLLMYRPAGRDASADADTLGQQIGADWLEDGDTHTIDVAVSKTKYVVYVDGSEKLNVDEGRTQLPAIMDIGAFGNPGAVIIHNLAIYKIKT